MKKTFNQTKERWILLAAMTLATILWPVSPAGAQAKREFRGAWIQCVNGQFQGMSTRTMQQTLSYQLDELRRDGVNAIIFQVRPECDALYESKIEPWSRFLTGVQGKAPNPYWDPLAWMVDECHKRGMELHAWINPYRAKTKTTKALASNHIASRKPANCFDYDGLKLLNPALAENRDYICQVVADIVQRYDIDGMHIDDYFYPYPVAGVDIPDQTHFQSNNNGIKNIGDWRRYNVNLFIEQLYNTVHQLKPWVKVGISPFGIYRNKRNSDIGSNTSGLQNYDDLYADVLMWVNNGWLDYCVPQVYWEIGHKSADYETLVKWWDHYVGSRHLYIGEDIERTVKATDLTNPSSNQMPAKFRLHEQLPNIKGTVLWYAKAAVDDVGKYGTMLRNHYWRYPALTPTMSFLGAKTPGRVKRMKPVWTSDGYMLFWTAPKGKTWKDEPVRYVVYRFAKGEKVNLNNPAHIVGITSNCFFPLAYEQGKNKFTYVVTTLGHLQDESKGRRKTVKL